MKYKWGILNHNITYINEKQLIHIKWMKKWVTIVEGLMVGDRKMTIGYIRWCFGEFVCKFKVFQGRGGWGWLGGWGAGGRGGGSTCTVQGVAGMWLVCIFCAEMNVSRYQGGWRVRSIQLAILSRKNKWYLWTFTIDFDGNLAGLVKSQKGEQLHITNAHFNDKALHQIFT